MVIDPDAAGEDGTLVEDGQLIAVERSSLSDDTSEQVTRWAAALEGYRKEQVRLGIPYGEPDPSRCSEYVWNNTRSSTGCSLPNLRAPLLHQIPCCGQQIR